MKYTQNWVCGVVIEKIRCEGRSRVRNLPDAMCTKTVVICDFGGMDTWLTGEVLHELIFFLIFKISFLKKFFAVCFLALGKLFYHVPDKWHTAKDLFTDAYLPCAFCRVQHMIKSLSWVFWPVPCAGKRADSRSALLWVLVLDPVKFLLVFIDLLPSCY